MVYEVKMIDLIALHEPIKDNLDKAIQQVIASGTFVGGPMVTAFEDSWSEYLGIDGVVGCGNGTEAIEIALRAMNIDLGDEVILQNNTCAPALEAVVLSGAVPILADIETDTHNLSPDTLKSKINSKTKVIIITHLYGNPAPVESIIDLANHNGIMTIEDCSHAHGAAIENKKLGTWADAGTFSFYPTKNLGAMGDGGAIVSHNHQLLKNCRRIANHGQHSRNAHVQLGKNSRLDPIQAAVLLEKLTWLDQWNDQRRKIARRYNEAFEGLPVTIPIAEGHVFHQYVIRTTQRKSLMAHLEERGIESDIHYPYLLSDLSYSGRNRFAGFTAASKTSQEIVSLPVFPTLTDEQVDQVIQSVQSFFQY
jgi:dTDP-4-amino-4,6-dideoxygalactose transaminase